MTSRQAAYMETLRSVNHGNRTMYTTRKCDWCGFATVQEDHGHFETFDDNGYQLYLCPNCTRHASGISCAENGQDPGKCTECSDSGSLLRTWTWTNRHQIHPVPSVEWMEAHKNFLECQRRVLDTHIAAVESELKKRKVDKK